MTQNPIDPEAIRRHIEYLYTMPIEALEEMKRSITTGAYSKMLMYVYLDRTLPDKESRAQIKV